MPLNLHAPLPDWILRFQVLNITIAPLTQTPLRIHVKGTDTIDIVKSRIQKKEGSSPGEHCKPGPEHSFWHFVWQIGSDCISLEKNWRMNGHFLNTGSRTTRLFTLVYDCTVEVQKSLSGWFMQHRLSHCAIGMVSCLARWVWFKSSISVSIAKLVYCYYALAG